MPVIDYRKYINTVDGFYNNPEMIRETALSMEFDSPPPLDIDNPQNGGAARRVESPGFVANEARQKIEALIGKNIGSFSLQYRYTLANFSKRAVCHIDGSDYSAVMYLTEPEHCQGGTSLFRHIPSNTIHGTPGERYDFSNESDWELTYQVDMKFNRMVVYPGNLFHSITAPFFGNDIKNGRLTQTMFIYM